MASEPFKWFSHSSVFSSTTSIVNPWPEGVDPDANTLTLAKLEDMARNLPKPHPLAGLTVVYYADNMRDAAHEFVDAYNGAPPFLRSPIVAALNQNLPLGHIIGMRGQDVVMIAGPEKEAEAP